MYVMGGLNRIRTGSNSLKSENVGEERVKMDLHVKMLIMNGLNQIRTDSNSFKIRKCFRRVVLIKFAWENV